MRKVNSVTKDELLDYMRRRSETGLAVIEKGGRKGIVFGPDPRQEAGKLDPDDLYVVWTDGAEGPVPEECDFIKTA